MARGLWRQLDQPLQRGDVVIGVPTGDARAPARCRSRSYLGGGDCPSLYEPLLKPIGMPGDTVVVRPDGLIEVNGTAPQNSRSRSCDGAGRPLFGFPPGTYVVDREASDRLCVARVTAQFFLRISLSHSLIFARKTGCASMTQASSSSR